VRCGVLRSACSDRAFQPQNIRRTLQCRSHPRPGKESTVNHVWQKYLLPWTDELGRIHCLQKRRLIHTGTAVLGNQTDLYKPPLLTEADMQSLRDLAALNKAHPLVRAHDDDLFPSLFVPKDPQS
jgi:hypothetical protein